MAQRHKTLAAFPTLLRSLRNPSPQKPFKPSSLPSLRRAFSLYDQINLIDQVNEEQLRFESFTDTGFTVNGVQYEGSLLCVGNMVLSWSLKRWSELIPDSLSVFQVLRPSPDILIVGCGRNIQPVGRELRQFVRSIGVKLEAVDSRNAASTYNILNEEGRLVAAAVLPYGVQD